MDEHEGHIPTQGEERLEKEVEKEAETILEAEDVGEPIVEDEFEDEESEGSEEKSEDAPKSKPRIKKAKDSEVDNGPKLKETPEMVKIRERLSEIKGKMLTLKWDDEHGQLNPGKKSFYEKLKVECHDLEQQLKKEIEVQA